MSKVITILENLVPLTGGEFLMSDADRVSLINAINSLEDTAFWVECLEAAGVDNWRGYEQAQALYEGDGGY